MLLRVIRAWWNREKLLKPTLRLPADVIWSRQLKFRELHEGLLAGPQLLPYQPLSEFWEDYADRCRPDYFSYLGALARGFQLELRSILDLASGTGALSVGLSSLATHVICLDNSVEILQRARTRWSAAPR